MALVSVYYLQIPPFKKYTEIDAIQDIDASHSKIVVPATVGQRGPAQA